jgi:ferredoxin--NADP+ reductase
VGDSLLVQSQATGFLTLDEIPPGRDLWLLSTGTAIGPFLAMLAEGQVFDRFEHLVLVHGVRKGKSSAISRLSPVLPSSMASVFAMFPSSVVRPGRGDGRRIPAAIVDGSLQARVGLNFSPS